MAQKWVNSCVCLTTVSGVQAETEDVEKLAGFCSIGYFEFCPQNWQKGVRIGCPE